MDIKILDERIDPFYATKCSCASDLMASIEDALFLYPNETKVILSGIAVNINDDSIAALVLPRSGQSIKHLVVANSPGLIDSDYQGEIGVIVHNNGNELIKIEPLDRIAQLMFVPVIKPDFKVVYEFSSRTGRGSNGFGSSGK